MLEGSEAMSECMNAELQAWIELQLPMLLVRRLRLFRDRQKLTSNFAALNLHILTFESTADSSSTACYGAAGVDEPIHARSAQQHAAT